MGRVLVGRARELDRLQAAVDDVESGRGRVLLLTGEPGIGKSRLAEEAARLIERRGRRVLWGRCWEAGAAPPLWPWIQVLRALEREQPDGTGDGELAELLRRTPGSGDAPVASDRFELFDAIARRLAAAASARWASAVVLEDLHAGDRATLLLLAFLAHTVRGVPLLLLGTFRDAEARMAPERGELLAQVARGGEVLALGRLTRTDVAHLVVDALPVTADDPLVDRVHTTTEGNPLFVDEVLRLLEVRGESAHVPVIPDGVRATIREHLARLEPTVRAALDAAAVAGRELAVPVVAAMLEAGERDAAGLLAEAQRAGLLDEVGPRTLRFSHVLVRDTVHDDLAPARRAELHRRCAESLAALHAGDPSAPLADIAAHFAEAGPEWAEASIEYALRAGRAARSHLAFEEAVPLVERALAAAERAAPGDCRRRAAILAELGESRILAGDGDGGRQACRQAADIARAAGSVDLLAGAARAFGLLFTFGRVDAELCALLEETLAALSADGRTAARAARARLLARLAGALQPARDPTVPIARAREAIDAARELGDEATLLEVLVGAGSALQDIADPRERLPLNRELLALAGARGDRASMMRGHLRLASDHLEACDPAAADAEMRAYERLVQSLGHPRHRRLPALWWAMRALMRGRFVEHAEHLAGARRLGEADPEATGSLGCHLFLAARLRGERAAAAELVAGARWFLDGIPALVAATEALLLADAGRAAEARTALRRVPCGELCAAVPTIARGLLAEAVAGADDAELAAPVYDALLPYAHRLGAWGRTGMYCDGPVHRHLALLAATAGHWEQAESHWDEANAIARADDMRAILLHLALERAEALARRGRQGDDAVAAELAAGALGDAQALGVVDLAERAARIAGRPPTRPAAIPSAPAPLASVAPALALRLEGEFWTVEGEGATCRMRDSVGMRMLALLVGCPGRELHALELAAGGAPHARESAAPVLDQAARLAYRARLRELQADLEQAQSMNQPDRAQRARSEMELVATELTRAVGLGGRDRRSGSAAERARVNAQRRLTDAIRRIDRACPALGRHLEGAIHTGTFCCYDPTRRKRR